MDILDQLRSILGEQYVKTGKDAEPWTHDWTNTYHWQPLAVVRPSNTAQVQAIARACFAVKSVATPSVVFDGDRADPAASCQPPHVLIRPPHVLVRQPRDADLLRFQCD